MDLQRCGALRAVIGIHDLSQPVAGAGHRRLHSHRCRGFDARQQACAAAHRGAERQVGQRQRHCPGCRQWSLRGQGVRHAPLDPRQVLRGHRGLDEVRTEGRQRSSACGLRFDRQPGDPLSAAVHGGLEFRAGRQDDRRPVVGIYHGDQRRDQPPDVIELAHHRDAPRGRRSRPVGRSAGRSGGTRRRPMPFDRSGRAVGQLPQCELLLQPRQWRRHLHATAGV